VPLLAVTFFSGCAEQSAPQVAKTAPEPAAKASAKPVNAPKSETKANAEWGDLVGRFVFDGPIPLQEPISINKDVEFCSKHNPVDETLVVDRENRGIANVVVRLETKSGDAPLVVHDSYRESESARVALDNRGCRFSPRICVLRTTQTLVISNNDEVSHNTAAYLDRNDPFNEVTAVGQSTERRIERPERVPVKVACSIHPWMSGWLVVSDHPYAAVTDATGRFRIKNVPTGERTFQVWQEKAGWIARGLRDGRPVEWKRGRVTVTIKPGDNDLGEIHLTADVFSPQE
jgi:hypothetical protein